jgi:hypothetical protein
MVLKATGVEAKALLCVVRIKSGTVRTGVHLLHHHLGEILLRGLLVHSKGHSFEGILSEWRHLHACWLQVEFSAERRWDPLPCRRHRAEAHRVRLYIPLFLNIYISRPSHSGRGNAVGAIVALVPGDVSH